MVRPSEHPEFKQIAEEWERKLRESGFDEPDDLYMMEVVKKINSRRYYRMDPIQRQAKEDFYRLVGQNVADTQFSSPLEREILTLYAQGLTFPAIQERLNIPGNPCRVYGPIYRWLKAWGLKKPA